MNPVILLDLDNCIADDQHRIPLIDWSEPNNFKRYDYYHMALPLDEVGNQDLFLGRSERIAICTARPEAYRAMTAFWLRKHGVFWSKIVMRGNNDPRPSHEVKRTQLLLLLAQGLKLEQIVCAYDDRQQVLDVYREYGIPVEHRWIHNVSAYRGSEA